MQRPANHDEFIDFSPPCLGEEEIAEVVDTLRSAWLTTGPKVRQFEQEFGAAVNAPAVLAVNSCTAALELALEALGIGPGDEVISTTLTFVATINVIEHRGARPVLVDVEPDTLNIDPAQVERAITNRTKAILPVHFAGHPVDMTALAALARKHGLAIVEDAAHALPAKHGETTIGGSENLTAFSFYVTKNVTTGEGGMLTGPAELIDRARLMSLHGMDRNAWSRYSRHGSWFYEVVAPGFKCNLTDIQASIGLQQLRKMDRFQTRRRQVWEQYDAAFGKRPALQTPTIRAGIEHARHLYVLRLRPEVAPIDRNQLIDELKQNGIGASVHFIPIHLHPYYRDKYGFSAGDFPVALSNFERMLSLPLHPGLRDDQVERIVNTVLRLTSASQRSAA